MTLRRRTYAPDLNGPAPRRVPCRSCERGTPRCRGAAGWPRATARPVPRTTCASPPRAPAGSPAPRCARPAPGASTREPDFHPLDAPAGAPQRGRVQLGELQQRGPQCPARRREGALLRVDARHLGNPADIPAVVPLEDGREPYANHDRRVLTTAGLFNPGGAAAAVARSSQATYRSSSAKTCSREGRFGPGQRAPSRPRRPLRQCAESGVPAGSRRAELRRARIGPGSPDRGEVPGSACPATSAWRSEPRQEHTLRSDACADAPGSRGGS